MTSTAAHSLRTAPEPDPVPTGPAGAPQLDESADGHPLRRDGDLMLTGHAEFLDDIAPPGLLHAAILRSPHPHARIRAVRTAAAERMRGVHVVLEGRQAAELVTPMPHFFDPSVVGCNTTDFRCLAVGKVRWVGEPVAAVVAGSLGLDHSRGVQVRLAGRRW